MQNAKAFQGEFLTSVPHLVYLSTTAEGEVEFAVLNVLQFDATRKRMSIIVQHPLSKEIILFVKGADSAILSVLHKKYKGLLGFGCVVVVFTVEAC